MIRLFLILFSILYLLYADEECKRNYSVRQNSIILTKVSQSKGASFIHKQVVSMFRDCYSLCCSNPDCTVAVYENKVNHVCFLFNCKEPNVCLFTDHDDYISMLHTSEQESKTVSLPIKTKVVSNKILVRPSMDAALGETCGNMRKCGPANSMCTSGTCICQLGYIGRGGLCVRSLCPKPELMFQCLDVSKSPFCIALYDQCNGILECGDGSDEVNCEQNQYRRPVFNETYSTRSINRNPKPKAEPRRISHNSQSNLNNQNSNHKKHTNTENRNYSHQNLAPRKSEYTDTGKSRKSNQMAENQLLLLTPKHKPPKYPQRSSLNRPKVRQQYQKVSSPPDNGPIYEKPHYSKMKMQSYPAVSRADEYYQKGSPDQSEMSNRWGNSDSGSSSDYEYPQVNSNSRDSQSSDWDPDQYQDPSESDSGAKYPSDRGSYPYYTEYSDEPYPKPRGRFLSDSDRFRPKYASNNGYEPSMDYSIDHKESNNGRHRLFANLPAKPEDKSRVSTVESVRTGDKRIAAAADDDTVSRSMNEWNTAIIALSLGLLVTAGLLVAVGLKMRTWRRRLKSTKKGKCLTTDEGDYLINGMYL